MNQVTRFAYITTLAQWHEGHLFYVDITLDKVNDAYYAHIWEDSYGVKDLMFGSLIHNQHYDQPMTVTADYFIELVEANFEEYADGYLEDREFEEEARNAAYMAQMETDENTMRTWFEEDTKGDGQ